MPKTRGKASIQVSPGWHKARRAAGFETDVQLAAAMGINPSTIYRVENGQQPSADFIAAALVAFGMPMHDVPKLFSLVVTPAKRDAA